ncbi:MAG: 50S ribosomal protein L25/general stress protein Ctc [Rhizobiales bacterium PAR1]|nr:MAG: 50S ribosomal protein L25/general stress protein Ctc [Rhizobiales bacterium PAR1]
MSTMKNLSATRRAQAGKGAARAIRREGRVPAVIYGGGQAPISISLDFKETNRLIYAGHFLTTLFTIDVEGEKIRAIPRDYQLDVVRDFPMHVDFLRLGEGAMVKVEVPVHVVGQEASPGLKAGGALNLVHHSLEFMVPAEHIPDHIDIDVSKAKIGDSIHVSAIKLPEGAKLISHEKDVTIATIVPTGGSKDEA